jgi:hypothetical protein
LHCKSAGTILNAVVGWGANNHGGVQWPETNTTKQPNITKTPPRHTVPLLNIMARATNAKGKEHAARAKQHSQTAHQHSEQAHSKSQQQK